MTGLDLIVETIFPSSLGGFIGRLLIAKLLKHLVGAGLFKKQDLTSLKKPFKKESEALAMRVAAELYELIKKWQKYDKGNKFTFVKEQGKKVVLKDPKGKQVQIDDNKFLDLFRKAELVMNRESILNEFALVSNNLDEDNFEKAADIVDRLAKEISEVPENDEVAKNKVVNSGVVTIFKISEELEEKKDNCYQAFKLDKLAHVLERWKFGEVEDYDELADKMDKFNEIQLQQQEAEDVDTETEPKPEVEEDEEIKEILKKLEDQGYNVMDSGMLDALYNPESSPLKTAGIGDYSFNEAFNAAEKKMYKAFEQATGPEQKDALLKSACSELDRQYQTAQKKLRSVNSTINAIKNEIKSKIGEDIEASARVSVDIDEVIESIAYIRAVNRVLVAQL